MGMAASIHRHQWLWYRPVRPFQKPDNAEQAENAESTDHKPRKVGITAARGKTGMLPVDTPERVNPMTRERSLAGIHREFK
jgi:hypothetical protein